MKSLGQPSIISARSTVTRVIRTLVSVAIFSAAVFSLSATDATNAYAAWIQPWSQQPTTSAALDGAGLKLIISNVRGEKSVPAVATMTPLQRLDLAYHLQISAAEVATNGSYVVSNTDTRTGDVRWLSPNGILQLDKLISILPEDDFYLPPAGNRIVVQSRTDGQWSVRVYDGNNLPPEAQAILNLLAKPYAKLF
jgi:hypothetical protein